MIATYVEHIDESLVILRNFFVMLNPLKLALEGFLHLEILPLHHFDCPKRASNRTSQKHLSIGTSTDLAEDLIAWNCRNVAVVRNNADNLNESGPVSR